MNINASIMNTKFLARVGIFGAISILFYTIRGLYFPLPFFPSFLEVGFSEIPIFIAGYSFGPIAVILITILRMLVKLPFSSTFMVGEIADLIYTLAFILPAVLVYQRHRTKERAAIGFALGFVIQLVVTSLANALFITDIYIGQMGISQEDFIGFIQMTNPLVMDPYWSLVLWVYLPFNAIKNTLVIVLTFLTYKRISGLISQSSANHSSEMIQKERYALVYFMMSAILPFVGVPLWFVFNHTNKTYAAASLNGVFFGLVIWLLVIINFIV
jgi:riboflavin transporter FmnP